MAENNGRAPGRAASRAIRLLHQLSALSCQLSVISSLRLGRKECRFFVFQFHAAMALPCVALCSLCGPCGSGFSSLPQRTQRILGGTLKQSASDTSFPVPGARGCRFVVAKSPMLSPVSRRVTLSTIRHRL